LDIREEEMIEKASKIEDESFLIIEKSLKGIHPAEFLPVVKRVVHATGDFDYEEILKFHPLAIKEGIGAIRSGKDILVDVKMVEAGINKRILQRYGGRVICNIGEPDVMTMAKQQNMTRAEIAIEKSASEHEGIGIVAIGNAPTALLKSIELIERQIIKPALVVGVPVGFVKAEESKNILATKSYPFITCLGTKGGSSVAAAIINALLKMADTGLQS